MLIYRVTTLSSSLPAPVVMLNGRIYRSLLTIRSLMQDAHRQFMTEQMVSNKERSAEHQNKSARDLPPLPIQQKAYVQGNPKQKQWTPATIPQTPTATQPRSYSVDTKDGAHYQRNRRFIWPAGETFPPGEITDGVITSSNIMERTTWEVKRPERLTETMQHLILIFKALSQFLWKGRCYNIQVV